MQIYGINTWILKKMNVKRLEYRKTPLAKMSEVFLYLVQSERRIRMAV